MNDAPTLPFLDNARPTDPITSKIAAAHDRSALRRKVRAALAAAGSKGLTDWELTHELGLPDLDKPSVGKRRQECDAVKVDGFTRPSPKGSACHVWFLPGLAPTGQAGAA